jgi:hypothetical protein
VDEDGQAELAALLPCEVELGRVDRDALARLVAQVEAEPLELLHRRRAEPRPVLDLLRRALREVLVVVAGVVEVQREQEAAGVRALHQFMVLREAGDGAAAQVEREADAGVLEQARGAAVALLGGFDVDMHVDEPPLRAPVIGIGEVGRRRVLRDRQDQRRQDLEAGRRGEARHARSGKERARSRPRRRPASRRRAPAVGARCRSARRVRPVSRGRGAA